MAGVFHIPGIDERTTIVGKTGSGKTQGGAYILSQAPFNTLPYVLLDFKREKLFREIPEIRPLQLGQRDYKELNQPGLFIVNPLPVDEDQEKLDALLWHIWERENCGIFVDEGYMLRKSTAFVSLLTQGRSKNIPIITLTQRPRFITPFVFSEAEYLMIFRLTKPEDRKTVQDYVDADISERLPPYHSYWYDVARDQLVVLRPVPDREWIKSTIRGKLDALTSSQKSKQFV